MIILCAMLGAATASAATFTTTTNAPATISAGDTFTAFLDLDAADFVDQSSLGFGISVGIDGTAFEVVSGGGTQTDPVFGFDTGGGTFLGGLPLLSPLPPNNTLDPDVVRMGVWGAAAPVAAFWIDGQEVATVTLRVLPGAAAGPFLIAPFFAPGDGFDLGGPVEDSIILIGETVTVPEPGAGLLSLAALASVLGIVRVRREC